MVDSDSVAPTSAAAPKPVTHSVGVSWFQNSFAFLFGIFFRCLSLPHSLSLSLSLSPSLLTGT